MASSQIPVVDILDDDDDDLAAAAFASPPSSRKRSHGSAASTSSEDFRNASSPSPPRQKRLALAAGDPIVLDDTPSPPKRRPPSSAPKLPVLVVDDDDDPLAPDEVVRETPDSVLHCPGFSETPEMAVPSSSSPGTVVAETPGFTSSRSVGPTAALGLSSATPAHKFSGKMVSAFSETPEIALPSSATLGTVVADTPGFTSPRSVGPTADRGPSSAVPAQKFSGVSSIISLDSDNEPDDDTMPLINVSSNTPKSDLVVEHESSFCSGAVDNGTINGRKNYLESSVRCGTTVSTRMQEGKKLTKEERTKLMEERKRKQQEDKLQKQALKAQLADKKKKEKEIQNWESGKFALECITAEIDTSIIESGSIGGPLLSSLSENSLSYKPTKNEISGSVLWKMDVPANVAQALSSLSDGGDMSQSLVSRVKYIAIVLQAEEFCDLISSGSFFNHVRKVQNEYQDFTICYITNKLMSYINKREQSEYKKKSNTWKRPPVEEVLCKLATHYTNVHTRQCIDEAEVAEHLVGLTSNLAKCQFRKPLTWLSVHANGAIISKDFVDKNLAKKDTWLKALIAIPDIQPRYAMAIKKKYPSMRSLLNEYMDPSKTVREKELLLSDLKWENKLGEEAKRLGDKCSRRVYRMLMAQNGDLDTDDPEAGGKASR